MDRYQAGAKTKRDCSEKNWKIEMTTEGLPMLREGSVTGVCGEPTQDIQVLISVRDGLKKKNVIFSDIVTIAFDPHPP